MCAAPIDFTAERRLIEASDDPHEILDWIAEYHQHARHAAADEDTSLERQIDELIEFATDQVVERKAARLRPPATGSAEPALPTRAARPDRVAPDRQVPRAAPVAQIVRAPKVDVDEAGRRESARRRAAEQAAANAAAEAAEAEQDRADHEKLRQLQERAAKAKARRDAALAETARIEGEARRAAAEAERARREEAKRRAAKVAEDAERAAAEAEAGAQTAASVAVNGQTAVRPQTDPARAASEASRPRHRPAAGPPPTTVAELTPIGRLFQERLAEGAGGDPVQPDRATPIVGPTRVVAATVAPKPGVPTASPARTPAAATPAPPKPPPPPAGSAPPPADPLDGVPLLTGADLTSFRTWLGASQRALAAKFGVEQSTISRSEGKPTAVLAPALRRALHVAMGEPRESAGRAS